MTRAAWFLGAAGLGLALAWAPARADAIELRFKPKVGQETKHRLMMSARIEDSGGNLDGAPSVDRSQGTVRIDFARKPTGETSDATTIETRQLDAKVDVVTSEGKQVTITLPPFTSVANVDRRRQQVGVEDGGDIDTPESDEEGTGCEVVGSLGIGCGQWANFLEMLALPADPVEVGATWKHEERTDPGGSAVVINYKLEELATRSGHKCAKIRITWRHEFSLKGLSDLSDLGDIGQSGRVGALAAEGVSAGDLIWYYDYENSVDVSVEGTVGNETTTAAFKSTEKALVNLKIVLVE